MAAGSGKKRKQFERDERYYTSIALQQKCKEFCMNLSSCNSFMFLLHPFLFSVYAFDIVYVYWKTVDNIEATDIGKGTTSRNLHQEDVCV